MNTNKKIKILYSTQLDLAPLNAKLNTLNVTLVSGGVNSKTNEYSIDLKAHGKRIQSHQLYSQHIEEAIELFKEVKAELGDMISSFKEWNQPDTEYNDYYAENENSLTFYTINLKASDVEV